MANEFKIRKGLIVQGSGSTIVDIFGSQGELFSVTDSLSGSLFSVNNIFGIPIMEVFSNNTINMGTFTQEAIIISGSRTGMGITIPQAKLHISGANNDSLFRIQSPASSSIIFVSGSGNVGIGTSTPTNTLQVVGGVTATSFTGSLFGTSSWAQNALTASFLPIGTYNITSSWAQNALTSSFITPTGTNAFVQGGNSFGTTTILGTNDNQDLQFETSGSVRMTISSSGNVGIGTVTPTQKLEVSDNINNALAARIQNLNTSTNASSQLAVGSAGAAVTIIAYSANHTSRPSRIWINSDSAVSNGIWMMSDAGPLRFSAGNTNGNHLFISSSGNVGIGTTTPTNTLNVNGTTFLQGGQTTIRGSGATSATTALRVENSSATARLTILDDGTSAFNTSHLYISSSGNVGIGTTSPSAKLHIKDGVLLLNDTTSNTNDIRVLTTSSNSTTPIQATFISAKTIFTDDGFGNTETYSSSSLFASGLNNTKIDLFGASSNYVGGPSNGNILIQAQNNIRFNSPTTTRLFISSSGNVGIGTATPSAQLHISGASAIMTLSPISPLPTSNVPSASFATSGSGADLKPYFWNGSSWTALF